MATVEAPVVTEIKTIAEDEFINAQKGFQTGKKNLFLNKYDESVNNIGDACKIYSAKFGEMDPQCAEIYFFYGRALLELARVENTVLGNAMTGVPEDDTPINDSRYGNPDDVAEEEQNEICEKVVDALCEERKPVEQAVADKPVEEVAKTTTETTTTETSTTETTTTPVVEEATTKVEEKTIEKTETTETTTPVVEVAKVEETVTTEKVEPMNTTETPAETTTEKAEITEKDATTETTTEKEAEEESESEDEEEATEEVEGEEAEVAKEGEVEAEDISNLQRAWEMFELAKLVYTKHFDNDLVFKNKRIAECLLKLGEISIEQEIYEQAITDISESIRIQEEQKENRDERMLAESFYQLGLCQQFNNMYKEANETYQKSTNIMQLRIEKLKGKMESIDKVVEEAEFNRMKEEITELEALLPEMMSKLEEVNAEGEKSLVLIKEAKEMMMNTVAPTEAATKAPACVGEVKDITNMVKSKRKFDATDETVSVKKTRLSDIETEGVAAVENTEPVMETTEATTKVEVVEKVVVVEPAVQVAEPMVETVAPITV